MAPGTRTVDVLGNFCSVVEWSRGSHGGKLPLILTLGLAPIRLTSSISCDKQAETEGCLQSVEVVLEGRGIWGTTNLDFTNAKFHHYLVDTRGVNRGANVYGSGQ